MATTNDTDSERSHVAELEQIRERVRMRRESRRFPETREQLDAEELLAHVDVLRGAIADNRDYWAHPDRYEGSARQAMNRLWAVLGE